MLKQRRYSCLLVILLLLSLLLTGCGQDGGEKIAICQAAYDGLSDSDSYKLNYSVDIVLEDGQSEGQRTTYWYRNGDFIAVQADTMWFMKHEGAFYFSNTEESWTPSTKDLSRGLGPQNLDLSDRPVKFKSYNLENGIQTIVMTGTAKDDTDDELDFKSSTLTYRISEDGVLLDAKLENEFVMNEGENKGKQGTFVMNYGFQYDADEEIEELFRQKTALLEP